MKPVLVETGSGVWREVITQRHKATKNKEWGYTINLCVLVALCEEKEVLSFPTR